MNEVRPTPDRNVRIAVVEILQVPKHCRPGDPIVGRSFSIITVPASETVSPIHDRMPLRVAASEYGRWLDGTVDGPSALGSVLGSPFGEPEIYECDPLATIVAVKGRSGLRQCASYSSTCFRVGSTIVRGTDLPTLDRG